MNMAYHWDSTSQWDSKPWGCCPSLSWLEDTSIVTYRAVAWLSPGPWCILLAAVCHQHNTYEVFRVFRVQCLSLLISGF